jgi:hypothetical protein
MALLAFAGAASASVFVITPDTAGTDNLTAAISAANTDAASSNTIVLTPGTYTPLHQPINITKPLSIVADHSFQTTLGSGVPSIVIEGATAAGANPGQHFIVIGTGVSVRMDGFNIDSAGGPTTGGTFAAIDVKGTLTTYGVTFTAAPNYAVITEAPSGMATLNDSTLDGNNTNNGQATIRNGGTLTLNNTTLVNSVGDGIDNVAPGTFALNNSIVSDNNNGTPGRACVGGTSTSPAPDGSVSDDSSCGVQVQNDTTIPGQEPFGPAGNGGPETTDAFTVATAATNIGVNCPPTDGRFFPNPVSGGVTHCDAGAVTSSVTAPAGQQTTPPVCAIIPGSTHPQVSQQVSVQDLLSGVGPEPGAVAGETDNGINTTGVGSQTLPTSTLNVNSTAGFPPNGTVSVAGQTVPVQLSVNGQMVTYTGTTTTSFTGVSGGTGTFAAGAPVSLIPTAYPPTASPVPGYAITNEQIDDGTVMFTPFTSPSTNPLVLTATRTGSLAKTHWSFTALNWAGVSQNCF